MGMRLRLDPDMTDQEILARTCGPAPAGYEKHWRMATWMMLFAIRDYGISVADSVPSNEQWNIQWEHNPTRWAQVLGPANANTGYSELIRSAASNGTSGSIQRPVTAGLPLDRIEVPARSVFPYTEPPPPPPPAEKRSLFPAAQQGTPSCAQGIQQRSAFAVTKQGTPVCEQLPGRRSFFAPVAGLRICPC